MEIIHIKAFELEEAWYKCLVEILKHGRDYTITKGSNEGSIRKEFEYVVVQITNPSKRPLVPSIPPGVSVDPPTSLEYIENDYFPRYLMSNIREEGERYTYGERLNMSLVDVIETYKELLKKNPKELEYCGTNQMTMEIACPEDIAPWRYHQHGFTCTECGHYVYKEVDDYCPKCNTKFKNDPPCLRLIDTRIMDRKLHFQIYFRSWDLWGGFPANLAGIQMLKEFMVQEIGHGLEDGEIIASSKGLHLYDYAIQFAEIRTYFKV